MKRCLSIDICAVHVHFVVFEQADHFVHVCVVDGMEHDVIADLLDAPNHLA